MPISRYGPAELEPYLGVYDQALRSSNLAAEPGIAQTLGSIYSAPTGAGGYTYGSALGRKRDALRRVAQSSAEQQGLAQTGIDIQKDADRRRFIANQAALKQQIENIRGETAKGMGAALTGALGEFSAPFRPGGDYYGGLKNAFLAQVNKDKNRAQERWGKRLEGNPALARQTEEERVRGEWDKVWNWEMDQDERDRIAEILYPGEPLWAARNRVMMERPDLSRLPIPRASGLPSYTDALTVGP
jgi:hypothetical protein